MSTLINAYHYLRCQLFACRVYYVHVQFLMFLVIRMSMDVVIGGTASLYLRQMGGKGASRSDVLYSWALVICPCFDALFCVIYICLNLLQAIVCSNFSMCLSVSIPYHTNCVVVYFDFYDTGVLNVCNRVR